MPRIPICRGIACTVALSMTLSACAVGPNYSRPQMPVPDQYRFFEGTAQAETLANAPDKRLVAVEKRERDVKFELRRHCL